MISIIPVEIDNPAVEQGELVRELLGVAHVEVLQDEAPHSLLDRHVDNISWVAVHRSVARAPHGQPIDDRPKLHGGGPVRRAADKLLEEQPGGEHAHQRHVIGVGELLTARVAPALAPQAADRRGVEDPGLRHGALAHHLGDPVRGSGLQRRTARPGRDRVASGGG